MSILDQNLLTLDFWQDRVSYGSQTLHTGSIACATLNITDEQISILNQLCLPLNGVILMVGTGTLTTDALREAESSMVEITRLMRSIPPFSCIDFPEDAHDIQQIFTDSFIENALAYIKATQELGAAVICYPHKRQ